MRLEDLTVLLRPRLPWEAGDLGCALVRRDFPRILGLWLATVVPVWVALAALLWDYPSLFGFLVWWLKPLYDRVPLHFLSRATFGQKPGFRDTWRCWPRLWSLFVLPSLLWRRFSLRRSFALPVWMLEGLRGKALRDRVSGLSIEGGMPATSLTYVFIKFELVVFFGLLFLTAFAAPESGMPTLEDWVDADNPVENLDFSPAFYWWLNLWYLVAVTVIEPFYVGAGFGLYLNCRTRLEGWDVEVSFRKTAARLRQMAQPAALLGLVWLCLAYMVGPAAAQEKPADAPPAADGNAHARDILARPDFEVHRKTERRWVAEASAGKQFMLTGSLMTAISIGISLIAVAVVLFFLLRAAARLRTPTLPAVLRPPRAPTVVMGLAVTEESLPADLLAAARAAWLTGAAREAVSLLYRGSLVSLLSRYQVPLEFSDTEDDCLTRAESHAPPPVIEYLRRLTRLWTRLAYANESPTEADFDHLCREWPFAKPQGAVPEKAASSPAQLALLSILALLLLPACKGHWEEFERETGHRGPARIDPFLAAQQFLEARGFEARRAASFATLPEPGQGLLLTSAESGMPTGRALPLLRWVEQGGHLVYSIAGGAPYSDWSLLSSYSSYGYFGNDDRPDPILNALGVEASDRRSEDDRSRELAARLGKPVSPDSDKAKPSEPAKTPSPDRQADAADPKEAIESPDDVPLARSTLKWGQQEMELLLSNYVTFNPKRELRTGEYYAGDPKAAYLLSLRHGHGRVTCINHARPLRNRYLGDADHGRFLDALAGPGPGEVLFVIGLEGSFWSLLWERGWRVILALACLLIVWLWATLPRFGPVRSAVLQQPKRFADHLESLGSFYLSIRRQDHLIRAAQNALQQRLRQTHPSLTETTPQLELLARLSGLPLSRVQQLVTRADDFPPSQIIRILQDLQHLRQSLAHDHTA